MKGLLFTPAMARAVCQGRKTVTRRVIAPQPWADVRPVLMDNEDPAYWAFGPEHFRCDYKVSERRCLLTTWAVAKHFDDLKPTQLPDSHWDGKRSHPLPIWHAGEGDKPISAGKSRPGRFLPNSLRHVMPVYEIASVRAERVQDITTSEIAAEGWERRVDFTRDEVVHRDAARDWFMDLWDSINLDRGHGWASNPWVWRVEFKEVKP